MKRKFTFDFRKWIYETAEIEADSFDEALQKAKTAFITTGAESYEGEILLSGDIISNYDDYPGFEWSDNKRDIKLIKEALKEE